MAQVRQVQVTFDCAEPEKVARFWCEVLGYVIPPPPEGFDSWDAFVETLPPERRDTEFACVDPTGAGPRLFFQKVPEGKVVKNRVHLDVNVSAGSEDQRAAARAHAEKLQAAGARPLREVDEPSGWCLVLQDPEGNEFCLQ